MTTCASNGKMGTMREGRVRMWTLVATACGLVAGPTSALAQPILLTFEDIPGMPNGSGALIPVASQLRDQYLASHGVRFSSGSPYVAVVVHGAATPSGTRILGGTTVAGRLTYNSANPVEAAFLSADGTQQYVVSDVSIRGDLSAIAGTKTLEAFNAAGQMIGTQTLQDSNTSPLRITMPGIHRVRAYSSSATVGFDDLRFDSPVSSCGSVCVADMDDGSGSGACDGGVTIDDLLYFLGVYSDGLARADVDDGSGTGTHDGGVTIDDLLYYLVRYEAGC